MATEPRKKKSSQWTSVYWPDPDLKKKLGIVAKARGTTPSGLIRDLVSVEVKRAR